MKIHHVVPNLLRLKKAYWYSHDPEIL